MLALFNGKNKEVCLLSKVTETVTEVVSPILKEHSFSLFDVEYVKENKNWYLRVYIDKPGGVTIDDCVLVSDALSEQLDKMDPDPIPEQYYLEVSSPGAERPLRNDKELSAALGEYIHVSLYQNLDGQKVFEGDLDSVNDDQLTLKVNQKGRFKEVTIPKKLVAKARLAIKF